MDRSSLRTAVLYGGAAAVLAAGALWYTGSAPDGPSARLRAAAARGAVLRALPGDAGDLVFGDAFDLAPGATREARAEEMPFEVYRVVMACAGEGRVQARVGASGRLVREVPCTARPSAVEVRRGLSGDVILRLTVESSAPVVFGWQLIRPD